MNITLYNNTSDNNVLNKNITLISTKTCDIKGEISLENPTFIVTHISDEFATANYVYVADYNRYYYITNKRGLLGGRMMLECSVDVLMSFKEAIKKLSLIFDRGGEDLHNPYYDNGTLVTDCVHAKEVIPYARGFAQEGRYILVTCGAPAEE